MWFALPHKGTSFLFQTHKPQKCSFCGCGVGVGVATEQKTKTSSEHISSIPTCVLSQTPKQAAAFGSSAVWQYSCLFARLGREVRWRTHRFARMGNVLVLANLPIFRRWSDERTGASLFRQSCALSKCVDIASFSNRKLKRKTLNHGITKFFR